MRKTRIGYLDQKHEYHEETRVAGQDATRRFHELMRDPSFYNVRRTTVIECCGHDLPCPNFTNTCPYCHRDYNMMGQGLAPRSQWGEETGESAADILSVDNGRWYDEFHTHLIWSKESWTLTMAQGEFVLRDPWGAECRPKLGFGFRPEFPNAKHSIPAYVITQVETALRTKYALEHPERTIAELIDPNGDDTIPPGLIFS